MGNFSLFDFFANVQLYWLDLGSHSIEEIMWILFVQGVWIIFLIVIIFGLKDVYMNYIKNKYEAGIKWTLLAIDIPKENLQSIRAVEHIFAAMWPFYEKVNLVEKYIRGKFQLAYALEIVSIGGYTQFLIRVPATHKDIVEAAFYAQYPKAEISEVEDYVARYRSLELPSEEYDLWGVEFGLEKPSPYPIRTHPSFEDTLTQTVADPMASLLEVFGKISEGEELWMQLIITPIPDDWKQEGYKIINKIIGAEEKKPDNFLAKIFYPFYAMGSLIEELFVYGIGYEPGKTDKATNEKTGPINKMLNLTPEEKNVVEGITTKISKLGYKSKFRMIYLGKKGQLNKPKGVASLIGAIQQFATLDLNKFKPIMKTATKVNYFFVNKRVIARQNRILRNFVNRGQSTGWGEGFVLNIEELASLFHVPVPEAKRESIKTVEAKKEVAPSGLPDEAYQARAEAEVAQAQAISQDENNQSSIRPGRKHESVKVESPPDLPI